jgi:hypothetical protein
MPTDRAPETNPPAAFFNAARRRRTICVPPRRGTPHFLNGTETTIRVAAERMYDGRQIVLITQAHDNAGENLATAIEAVAPFVARCLRIKPDEADWYEAFDPLAGLAWAQTHVQHILFENGAFAGLRPVFMPGLPHRADEEHVGALRILGFID